MKYMLSLCSAVLAAYLLFTCMPVHGEEGIYENVIRLHVLAQSDSAKDQSVKLQVRDAVLASLSDAMADADGYENALAAAEAQMEHIRHTAEEIAGCPVTVTLGRESYPVRFYGNFTLPAGEYMSLRVILGEGAGKNWWCVLFPQMCTAPASEDGFMEEFIAAGFTADQYQLIRRESGMKYKIRFRILEILSELIKE